MGSWLVEGQTREQTQPGTQGTHTPRLDTGTNVIITHILTVCTISHPRPSPLSLCNERRLCSQVVEK